MEKQYEMDAIFGPSSSNASKTTKIVVWAQKLV